MPRVARIVIAGIAHYITQRGNNRQEVFFVDDDRQVYLDLLHAQCQRYGFTVTGYCLMTNHVHIAGTPQNEDALAKAIGHTHYLYTQFINKMHERCQSPFSQHPPSPCDYPWSSAAAHCGSETHHPVLDMEQWRTIMPGTVWQEILNQFTDDSEIVETLRRHTHTGRPLGSDSFISKMETFVGRRLRPLPIGRPRGSKKPKKGKVENINIGDCPYFSE